MRPVTDLWVPIPVAFTQAFRNGDIHTGIYALGVFLADESFRNRHMDAGVVTVRVADLASQFNVGAEAMRLWLHALKDGGWIAFDVEPGRRKPWRIELNLLATSNATSNREGSVRLEVTSNSSGPAQAATPVSMRGSDASRPPISRARDEKKRKEIEPLLESDHQREQSGGARKLPYIPDLARFTGCRQVRGSHGFGHKHDPLGTDEPPRGWPHPRPTGEAIAVASA
jgi:hypothetical protein